MDTATLLILDPRGLTSDQIQSLIDDEIKRRALTMEQSPIRDPPASLRSPCLRIR